MKVRASHSCLVGVCFSLLYFALLISFEMFQYLLEERILIFTFEGRNRLCDSCLGLLFGVVVFFAHNVELKS